MGLDKGIFAVIGVALLIIILVVYVRYENKRQVEALDNIDSKIKNKRKNK